MDCRQARENMLEMAGGAQVSPETAEHLRVCAACAAEAESLRATMSLLDAWQAPEPSPYFDARLRARIRGEQPARAGWLEWLRKPALATALTVLLVTSVVLFQGGPDSADLQDVPEMARLEPGTAVADLQALDKNAELFSQFDLLDDFDVDEVNR